LVWVGIDLSDLRMGRMEKPTVVKGMKEEEKPVKPWNSMSWFKTNGSAKPAHSKKEPHTGEINKDTHTEKVKETPTPKPMQAQAPRKRSPPNDLEAQKQVTDAPI
jgi:hypothetical protein